eukprot:5338946-Pyramimonas_sp.AAC.1
MAWLCLARVRLACVSLPVSVDAFASLAVERDSRAVQAHNLRRARPKMLIREALLARLLKHLARWPSGLALRVLFSTASEFLLGLPSEGLPARVARASDSSKSGEPKCRLRTQ